jgi:hypothetical protein
MKKRRKPHGARAGRGGAVASSGRAPNCFCVEGSPKQIGSYSLSWMPFFFYFLSLFITFTFLTSQEQGTRQGETHGMQLKARCHTCFSEKNQVHNYMHAKIKFHAYSDK